LFCVQCLYFCVITTLQLFYSLIKRT
jgi:hypothetical protein